MAAMLIPTSLQERSDISPWPPTGRVLSSLLKRTLNRIMNTQQDATFFKIERVGSGGNIVDLVICLVSFFGCLVIIILYALSKNSRKLRHALILGLATSDLVSSLTIIITTSLLLADVNLVAEAGLCKFFGFVLVSSIFTQHLWNLSIAIVTYMILVHPLSSFTLTVERRLIWLWPAYWAVALLIHGIIWKPVNYGFRGGYCTYDSSGYFAPIFQFVPRAAVVVVIIILYTHLFFFLRRTNLFKAVSSLSKNHGSRHSQHGTGSKTASRPNGGAVEGTRSQVASANLTTDGTTVQGAVQSTRSSTTEALSGSNSSKRSLRTKCLSVLDKNESEDSQKRGTNDSIEMQQLQQRNAEPPEEAERELAADRAVAAIQGHGLDADVKHAEEDKPLVKVTSRTSGVSGNQPDTMDSYWLSGDDTLVENQGERNPSSDAPTDSPTQPRSSMWLARPEMNRSRSVSDPPFLMAPPPPIAPVEPDQSPALRPWQSNHSHAVSKAGSHAHLLSGKPGAENQVSLTDAALSQAHADLTSAKAGKGNKARRPATADKLRWAGNTSESNPKTSRQEGRCGNSRDAYTIGGKNGHRVVRRRASFGDSSASEDGHHDDEHIFTPMQPRKDVGDFEMITPPREHLKHLNAPKIWAKISDILAEGSQKDKQEVKVNMPTEEEFERALGDDWNWGMEVGTTGAPGDAQHKRNSPTNHTSSVTRSGDEKRQLRSQAGSNTGQVSTNTFGTSSTDENDIESLGSTLNRQASLLMLLYPAAYCLLFSVSIIRIIDDLVNPTSTNKSQDILHSISRWFVFAQGAFDAIIFQFIERQL